MAGSALIYAASLASDLPVGWSVGRFEDMVFYQEGPGIRNWQYVDEGVPFVNIRCLVDGKLVRSTMNKVSNDEAFGKYSHFLLQAEDFVVSSSGTLGRIATVRPEDLPCMLNTSIIRMRPKTEAIDRGFLKYFLHSSYYQKQILSFATGSAQLNYGPSHLKQMFIVVPPLPEQQAIASILGALDDKIDLNRRMNETLESMARAIFKSWFVDFDPVYAKMEGKQPFGMDDETAALFPDRLVESELGLIPEGWEVLRADQFSKVGIGKTPPRKEHAWFSTDPVDIRWMSIKDLGKCTVYIAETSECLTNEAVDRFNVRRIPGNTVVLSFKLTVGRVAITKGEMLSNEAIAHFLINEDYSHVSTEYLYCYLRQFDYGSLGSTSSIATAVNSKIIKGMPILIAPEELVALFTDRVGYLFSMLSRNQNESRTLAELRDLLLPKLVSGEIRVKEAEQMVEAAV